MTAILYFSLTGLDAVLVEEFILSDGRMSGKAHSRAATQVAMKKSVKRLARRKLITGHGKTYCRNGCAVVKPMIF
jgi:hypothetical protein